jgi:flagellar secretion chaperone FliS
MANPYQTYVDDEILTADPLKLVDLLYRGAIEAVGCARLKLVSGDIKARSAAVTKAIEILVELTSSLDYQRGGELSIQLAALYDYMQRRLIDANREQADAPLAEVEQILETVGEAWAQVKAPAGESFSVAPSPRAGNAERAPHEMARAE